MELLRIYKSHVLASAPWSIEFILIIATYNAATDNIKFPTIANIINITNCQLEKSNERKTEKKRLVFQKSSNCEFRQKQMMAFKLFEFVEQVMIATFLLKLTPFEKTGSIGKTFVSLRKLMFNFNF